MVLAEQVQKNTVQVLPDAKSPTTDVIDSLWYYPYSRAGLLAEWGTRQRERELRLWYRHQYNWMIQGAFAGLMKRLSSTPWEIKGPPDMSAASEKMYRVSLRAFGRTEPTSARPDIEYWQELLRQADFGRGWGTFVKKGIDYLRHDGGWFWEIVAPGNPTKPPTGPALGIAHLDSLRCIPTGDPEFPVVYIDRNMKNHIMHKSRVVQMVDMPDGDESHPGYGLCALSRAVSIAQRQILIGRYVEGQVDDKPPPGIVVASNILKAERDRAMAAYRDEQRADTSPEWGKQMWLYSADADKPARIETNTFQQPPEKFDFREYTELDVNAVALALGVDRQEIWELSGGNIGSGTQSEILHQKSKGKTFGDLLASIERAINDILPEDYEFAFKFRDEQEDLHRAQIAASWAATVASLGQRVTDDEARRILANQVEAVQDAISDENGVIVRRDDADVKDDSEDEAVTNDSAQEAGTPADETGEDEQVVAERQLADSVRRWHDADTDRIASKQFQSTLLEFEADFADAINAFQGGDITRSRFGIVARALLNRHGRKAMLEGLSDGGVETDTLDEDDANTFTVWLAEQSAYVTQLGAEIKGSENEIDAERRAGMWGTKSLTSIYQLGKVSADGNGLYEWVLGDAEHCKDCRRLAGQKHRLKAWHASGWLPRADHLECGGYHCACNLVKAKGGARGRF